MHSFLLQLQLPPSHTVVGTRLVLPLLPQDEIPAAADIDATHRRLRDTLDAWAANDDARN